MKKLVNEQWSVKHRPKKLEDFIGHENAVSIIKGIEKTGKLPATLLISGTTGSGKTTLARIIAKRFNGITDPDMDSPNIKEMNCGDARGVEDVRGLLQEIQFLPQNGEPLKVIILDECFPGDTQVEVEKGQYKTIQQICEDNSITCILSYSQEKQKFETKKIIRKLPRQVKENCMVRVHLIDGSYQDCTENHEWWSVDRQCMVKAKDLLEGEELLTTREL